MSKFETVDLRDAFKAQQTWANAKLGDLVILSDRQFEINEDYADMVRQQFEDPRVGILYTDHAVKKHESLINVYSDYNSIRSDVPFMVRKVGMELPSDKQQLIVSYKNSGLKIQHLAEPFFNVS